MRKKATQLPSRGSQGLPQGVRVAFEGLHVCFSRPRLERERLFNQRSQLRLQRGNLPGQKAFLFRRKLFIRSMLESDDGFAHHPHPLA